MNIQNFPREKASPPKACSNCNQSFADKKVYQADSTGAHYTCLACNEVTKTYIYDLRRAIVARKDHCFVCADWDQMEICVGAAVSGDETLLKILKGKETDPDNPNYDMHSVTAATIYGVSPSEVTPKQRQETKAVNFGALYGITRVGLREQLLANGIPCTEEEADEKLKAFFETYPGLKTWFAECDQNLTADLYITHPYGRIRHIVKDSDANELLSATNFVIQGWCASIMKECLNLMALEMEQNMPDSHVVLCIHDEIIIEAPIEDAKSVAEMMNRIMNIEIKDVASVALSATPEIKFTLSKGAKSLTPEEFTSKHAIL